MIDPSKAITILNDAGVAFVVIGGAAMIAHGSARSTQDLDICYGRSAENISRLAKALEDYHPRLRGAPRDLPFRFDAETIEHGLNFTLVTDIGDIDLLGEVQGLGFFDAVHAVSRPMEIYGVTCQILTLDGLIKAKRAAGRPRDLAVIPELEALRELEEQS